MSLLSLSLPVVVVAAVLATTWLTAGLLLPVWLQVSRQRDGLARATPLVVALPWLAGLALALGALLPGDPHTGMRFVCHCLDSMPAWLHLCPVHPEEPAALVAPAVVVLALLAPGRLRALARVLGTPIGTGGGARPRVVELGRPAVLLHGWLRPTLVVDRGLWAQLGGADRAAIVAHEAGHLARRDPLVLQLIQLALVAAPASLQHAVARSWLDHAERSSDLAAAEALGSPLAVAEALVRCARLGVAAPQQQVAWTGAGVESRVEHLLTPRTCGRPARPDVGGLELLALGGLLAGAFAASPWIHHQAEHLINLLH